MTQRTGSTLLCKALESTGIAGIPGEYFTFINADTLCGEHQVGNYKDLKTTIWKKGTSLNGVFGIKHDLRSNIYQQIIRELCELRGIEKEPDNHQELWEDLFPNCKHIYLTRRNKVRQAVSWWKAIHDKVWHIEKGQTHRNGADFYREKYDFNALMHLYKEATLKECNIQEHFQRYDIIPFTVIYEDFIRDYEATIRKIIEYLEIGADNFEVGPMYYEKTATDHSEEWVHRFRMELQKNMSGGLVW